MFNKFITKLIAVSVFGLILLPAQFVQAQVVWANPDQLIKNVQNAQSVDFSMDADFKVLSTTSAQSTTAHLELDGAADADRISAFQTVFSMASRDSKPTERKSSVVITPEAVYFTQDGVWYFIEQKSAYGLPTERELVESAANFKLYMQEMFNRGVITFQMESVDFVNGKMAVRYGYTVNSDKFITYLLEKKAISSDQATEARATAQGVVINGKFWVDTAAMLPVKLTVEASATHGSERGELSAVISFNSFNQPVTIAVPKNAKDYKQSYAPELKAKPVSIKTDTDSDGLTDLDEKNTWKTNPNSSDTDGDGYSDKTEVINGYNPRGAGKLDSDYDGLSDYSELTMHKSDRYNSDTDGDGYSDGLEVANGYSPIGPGRK